MSGQGLAIIGRARDSSLGRLLEAASEPLDVSPLCLEHLEVVVGAPFTKNGTPAAVLISPENLASQG